MSYHIYTTKSLVLSYAPVREADRIYSILTRDLGLVRASALGVRKEASKLRGALEPLSFSSISFVRGKEFWRITSAAYEDKAPVGLAQPLSLLEKLVAGEEAHPELFDSIEEAVRLYDMKDDMFEVRLVSSILFHLGYLEEKDLSLDRTELIAAINRGIEASGLLK